jgi:hypothetical protein
MMEAARTSETSVDNHFTREYIPEDNSELHTHRRENLKSHILGMSTCKIKAQTDRGHASKGKISKWWRLDLGEENGEKLFIP